jgi:uncharacterized protein
MSAFRIDVADLLTHRGARRPLSVHAPIDGLEVGAVRVREPVDVDVLLERVPDGIVVRGEIHARWEGECSHCLRDLAADLDLVVGELFEQGPGVDGETYPLDGHELDVEQLVRDAVLLELPLAPTCAGLGLVEGAGPAPEATAGDDREPNDGAPVDPRWAVLSELEL